MQEKNGLVDVFDEHKTGYMFCCEHHQSSFGVAQTCSFGLQKNMC
jgi:hypothetical protein